VPTVQEALEEKLRRITGAPTAVTGAGRTDAGVHATGQVVNFRTSGAIPTDRVAVALNSLPPYSIVARRPAEVAPAFHARFDAVSRSYRYAILRGDPSPFLRRFTHRVNEIGDLNAMREGAAHLVGRHDFASFCAAGAEVSHTVRTVTSLMIRELGDLVLVEITADGFLQNMVRIIAGTLLQVARGARPPAEVAAIRETRDRRAAGPTAPACGLCLTHVSYDRSTLDRS
jgi:tRNA pseudouridine38-40 synthase